MAKGARPVAAFANRRANMDFGRAITYITEDERWLTKIGIGGLLMLATIFLIFPIIWLIGYQIAIMRNVIAGKERPLPEWEDWGQLFMDGLMVTIALIVYTLPLTILLCIGIASVFLPIMGAAGSEELIAVMGTMTAAVWIVVGCLSVLLILGLMFVSPAVYVQYAITSDLKACFRFGEVFAIARDHLVNILITIAANIGANFVLQAAAGALAATVCGIVLALPLGFVGPVWIMAMLAHFYGQIGAMVTGNSRKADAFA
jgi:hypothetical protein